jgi:hypothetical protein
MEAVEIRSLHNGNQVATPRKNAMEANLLISVVSPKIPFDETFPGNEYLQLAAYVSTGRQ